MKLTIKDKEYVCKLTTKAIVEAEDRLGSNMLNILLKVDNNELPKLKDLLIIFHESLRYTHGIKFDDVYDIYQDYIDEGHTFPDFVILITDIMKDSGVIREPDNDEEDSKN